MIEKSKIAKNIKDVRRAFGEKQKELANAINVSENTISMYESGDRLPSIEKLQAIAYHYGFPMDRLMEDDFSWMDFKKINISRDKILDFFNVIFPIVISESAEKDPHFLKGYEHTQKILEMIKNPYDGHLGKFERAMTEYEKSLGEYPENTESAVNWLSLTFLMYSLLPNESIIKMEEALYNNKFSYKDFVKNYMLKNPTMISQEYTNDRKTFIKDTDEMISVLLRIIKHSVTYAYLADYFLALRYLMGMKDNGYGDELNKTIGADMMNSFAEMGNQQALSFIQKAMAAR